LIGDELEKRGWRQGTIVQQTDNKEILELLNFPHEDDLILIIASQSCDIANNNIEDDPYIEVSIARCIDKSNGNLTHNKNPRSLHSSLQIHTEDTDIVRKQNIQLKAFDKLIINKGYFKHLTPDRNCLLSDSELEGYVAWLASRYSRPALPTEFNNRIATIDPKSKLRKKAKGSNEQLSGIYVEINPDTELPKGENYSVNLLGLVSAEFEGDLEKVEIALNEYAAIMRQANMNVVAVLKKENEVSIADIKRFKRFYYDDLSFKNNTPLPPEVTNTL